MAHMPRALILVITYGIIWAFFVGAAVFTLNGITSFIVEVVGAFGLVGLITVIMVLLNRSTIGRKWLLETWWWL